MRPAAVLRVVHAPARTWERGTRDAVWRPWRREWRGDEKLAHAPAKRAASRVSLLAADTSEPSFNGGVALKPSRRALTRAPALALVPSRYACSYPPRAVGRTSRPSSVGRLENVTSYPQLQPPPSVTSVVPKQQPRVRRAASPLLRARRPETLVYTPTAVTSKQVLAGFGNPTSTGLEFGLTAAGYPYVANRGTTFTAAICCYWR